MAGHLIGSMEYKTSYHKLTLKNTVKPKTTNPYLQVHTYTPTNSKTHALNLKRKPQKIKNRKIQIQPTPKTSYQPTPAGTQNNSPHSPSHPLYCPHSPNEPH